MHTATDNPCAHQIGWERVRGVEFIPLPVIQRPRPGLSNMRPTGRMRPARQYCAAREVIYILIVLAELMK